MLPASSWNTEKVNQCLSGGKNTTPGTWLRAKPQAITQQSQQLEKKNIISLSLWYHRLEEIQEPARSTQYTPVVIITPDNPSTHPATHPCVRYAQGHSFPHSQP
jgi:hypothetical protein